MRLDKLIANRDGKKIYRDGAVCVKVFEEGYSKADILNEALNQARVEETGLSIPRLLEVTVVDGKWAIAYEFIEGETLFELMQKNPGGRDAYLNRFVDIQREMHAKKCPLLNKWKDKMNRKISASGLDATIRYELHMRIEGMPKHDKLCHGDFHPSNIIITPDDKHYIIDWAHATQGNASADTARTYLLFCLEDENLADAYMDKFCKKTDTARQYVQRWLPIVAASQLVKGKAGERDLLLRWANVADYE
jgi:aminoglycoside phosphotransferase (APT) family kinase protein